jgi:hypothetical protein
MKQAERPRLDITTAEIPKVRETINALISL